MYRSLVARILEDELSRPRPVTGNWTLTLLSSRQYELAGLDHGSRYGTRPILLADGVVPPEHLQHDFNTNLSQIRWSFWVFFSFSASHTTSQPSNVWRISWMKTHRHNMGGTNPYPKYTKYPRVLLPAVAANSWDLIRSVVNFQSPGLTNVHKFLILRALNCPKLSWSFNIHTQRPY